MGHKFWIRFLVIFAFFSTFEWIFHGLLLSPAYQATAALWRAPDTISDFIGWIVFREIFLAWIFCIIFQRGYRGGGLRGGFIWGGLIGLLMIPMHLIQYVISPYPLWLVLLWIVGGLVEFSLAGVVLAKIYEK